VNTFRTRVALNSAHTSRGATTAEKLRGTKVWVPTPGRLRPAPGQRPGWGECGRGSPPPAMGVRGCHPRKIFENSDAKILHSGGFCAH